MSRYDYYQSHDEPSDSLASPSDNHEPRHPRRPRPAVIKHSSYDSEPRSQHDRRESRRIHHGDRRERRKQPRDPERERRRQERAARDPEYAARRNQRRAERRAERRASLPVQDAQHRQGPLAIDRVKDVDVESHDDGQPEGSESPEGTVIDAPLPQVELAAPREHAPKCPDCQERNASPGRYRNRPSQRESRRRSAQYQSSPRADFDEDLESLSNEDEKQRPYSSSTSTFSELQWYKRGTIQNGRHYYRDDHRRRCCGFGRRCICISTIVAVVLLVVIIAVAVAVSQKGKFTYHVSVAQVNETAAFTSGAATRNSVNDTKDGVGAGVDVYTLHQGNATKFLADVPVSAWVSFEDMWSNNLETIQNSCGILNYGDNDSPEEIANIYNAIQDRATASLVDHRLILAFIIQESKGCVRVPHTTSSGDVKNTGLMQAHHGHEYTPKHSAKSILAMVQDGTQGTKKGNGLVQELNAYYGNPYAAARAYNSGYIPGNGELTEAAGATKCYVSDIANRLTGWVKAESSCSE